MAPGLDWGEDFGAAGLAGQGEFGVWQPSAVTGISALVAGHPLEVWKDYLSFHALEHRAAVLPRAFGEESFRFHGTTLAGIPQRRDRWKQAVDATNKRFARIEQIKRFAVLDRDLSQEHEELTPTMKVKRNVVYDRHGDVFTGMYEGG